MKTKRVLFLILLCFMTLASLTSCIAIPMHKHYDIDPKEVSSIEIYDLCETDSLYGKFHKTETSVYEIPKEKNADFLSELSDIEFSDTLLITIIPSDPSFYYDEWTVRVNYTDGSYELISCDYYGQTYNPNGEVTDEHHFGCERDEWRAFVEQYVPQDIFHHSQICPCQ